jgi:hypothetical protein
MAATVLVMALASSPRAVLPLLPLLSVLLLVVV